MVALDHGDVVGLLVLDQEPGVLGLRVQRVEGDHRAGQVERSEEGLEGGDFVGFLADLALGDDLAACGHRGEEVDLGAVLSAGAADGLAVDGQRTERLLVRCLFRFRFAVGEPGADRGIEGIAVDALQQTAHSGSGRGDRPGRLAHGPAERGEYGRWRV